MATVIMYKTPVCPYCVRAKALLERKGVAVQEIDITGSPDLMREMLEKSGGRKTVPQIFINGIHVGGCDDLHDLDHQGKLDDLLKGS